MTYLQSTPDPRAASFGAGTNGWKKSYSDKPSACRWTDSQGLASAAISSLDGGPVPTSQNHQQSPGFVFGLRVFVCELLHPRRNVKGRCYDLVLCLMFCAEILSSAH